MNEMLKQLLIDKSKRNKIAAKQVAQGVPTGEVW